MRTTTTKILALALVAVMVMGAGCSGWGTDGPADSDDSENDTTDDLEDAQNDTDTSEGDSDTDSDSSDSSDTSSDSSDSSDTTDSDGGTDDSASEDESTTGSSDPEPQGSDPLDGTSTGDDSTTDSDSDSDADDSKDTDQKDTKDSDSDSDSDPKDSDDTKDSDDKKSDDTDDGTDGGDGTNGDDGGGTNGDDTNGDDGDDTNGDDTNGDDTDTDEPETHELTVTVVNHNDDPLENASVSVVAADSGDEVASGTTDSDGLATFDLETGEYDVIADHEDALGDGTNRVILESDTNASVKLDTSDGKATGVVTVVDQNGDPVEGEPVILSPPGTVDDAGKITEHTDENGEVRIELAAGDPSDVVMYGVEVRDQQKTLGIMSDAHTEVQTVTFEIDTSGQMYEFERTVRVIDQNGDPIVDEPVEARHLGVEEWSDVGPTDENGEVVLTASSSESGDAYLFDVRVAGETTTGISVDNQDRDPVVIERTVENGNGEPETHELKVSVTDPDENPVEGASVSIVTYDAGEDVASGTTNSEGVATFDVPNGDYEAVVTTEDDDLLQPSDQRLVTVDGGDATLDVQMQGSGDNGNGNDEETHTLTLLAESPVTLTAAASGEEIGTKEPTDGTVTFEGLSAGEYTFDAEGYYNGLIFVDSDVELELQDTDGATMNITVVDSETGNPVGGAEIEGVCDLWYTGGDSYVDTVSASEGDGIVTVQTGVEPTSCDANVSAPGYEEDQISLDAPGDDGMTVELVNPNPDVPEPNETGDMNETNGNATATLA